MMLTEYNKQRMIYCSGSQKKAPSLWTLYPDEEERVWLVGTGLVSRFVKL